MVRKQPRDSGSSRQPRIMALLQHKQLPHGAVRGWVAQGQTQTDLLQKRRFSYLRGKQRQGAPLLTHLTQDRDKGAVWKGSCQPREGNSLSTPTVPGQADEWLTKPRAWQLRYRVAVLAVPDPLYPPKVTRILPEVLTSGGHAPLLQPGQMLSSSQISALLSTSWL